MNLTPTIKEKLILALQTGKFKPSDFPELLQKEEIIFPGLSLEEKKFFAMLNSRVEQNQKFKERFSPAVPVDRTLKVRILSSLQNGCVKVEDFPELKQLKAVHFRFMLSKDETDILSKIVIKNLNI